jgi:hypothetical protein
VKFCLQRRMVFVRIVKSGTVLLSTAIQSSFEGVKVMWNLLWRKKKGFFYYEGQPVVESVGFKGLPQGSALRQFFYGFYTSQADQFLLICCSILLYANDLAIYAAHYDVGNIQRTIKSVCANFNGFFREIGLSISEAKFELVLFSRKHTNPPIYVSLNGSFVPVVPNFRYFGVVFDGKLLWGHSCATSSRNVSRELTFFNPWRGYHRGHIQM